MDRILVIGGTGRIGREVAAQLIADGAEVRVVSRQPRSPALPAQIELAHADLTEPATLDAALDGVGSVFLVWTAPPDAVSAGLERITRRARRVVFLSSPYNVQHPFVQRPQPNAAAALHKAVERCIVESGVPWTFLRPGIFASNALGWWAPQIRAGDVVRWPHAQSQSAPTDERDIAAVAVRALCEEGHNKRDYIPTGPESLTHAQQVEIIGAALGRRLRYEEMSPEEFLNGPSDGWPPGTKQMLLKAWQGGLEQPAFITSDVKDVTGKPARTFRDWAKDHAAAFRA